MSRICVKNLPKDVAKDGLRDHFSQKGEISDVKLMHTRDGKNRQFAFIGFPTEREAQEAIRYFHNSYIGTYRVSCEVGLVILASRDGPLYLEWAPENVLNPTTESIGNKRTVVGEQDVKRVLLEQHVEELLNVDPDRIQSRSLFVKNLSFKTSDEALKSHFSEQMKEGRILNAKINKHVKNGKSMGYGFIEFDSVETAANICRDLQGTCLDGHALILQFCQVKKDETVLNKDEKDKNSTKLLVTKVAFEATKKDLEKLFSPFGEIKHLRLPRKFGNHRGFAFVEYVTKQEAQKALQALANTRMEGIWC